MDIEIREALTEVSAHQNEEAQGNDLDGRPTTGPSPADETNEESEHSSSGECGKNDPEKQASDLDEQDEGNTLPLCFEAFEIVRRGFLVDGKGHTLQFPGLSLSEIIGSCKDHDRSLEHPRTEFSDCGSTTEEEVELPTVVDNQEEVEPTTAMENKEEIELTT